MTLEPSQATLTVSPSEFYDRVLILEVKFDNVKDEVRRRSVCRLYEALVAKNPVLLHHRQAVDRLKVLVKQLNVVHNQLWDTENCIRGMDRTIFDSGKVRDQQPVSDAVAFMLAARQVYVLNDRRAEIKKEIDALFGQEPEVKEYTRR